MIETIGELIEELKKHDPNLKLRVKNSDDDIGSDGFSLVVNDVHQVSADFVWVGISADPLSIPTPVVK